MSDVARLGLLDRAAGPDDPIAYIREIFDREMGVTLHNFEAGSSRDQAMKNLTQEASNLYAKRVLRELIQNAFDGAAGAEAPRILLRLDRRASPHGVLYVANNGDGFTKDNVDAVVSPAMSNKTPGNFIGHKGLGFRSVELLSDDVQIFSVRGRGAAGSYASFDGFRFRFAQAEDEARWLVGRGAGAQADKVIGRVHRLQLPVPLNETPEDIAPFAIDGFATVVRLPLRDATATARAEEELRLLFDEKAPITLFLHRLAELTIERRDADGQKTRRSLNRNARPMSLDGAPDDLVLEEVTVDKARFLVARAVTDEARFRKSVEDSVAQRHPVERWRDWIGAPTVSVALPLVGDAETGAYYAFLPMERKAPFAGCLDAPFYPEADRRDLDLSIPLNGFLLDEIAGLCLQTATALADANEVRPSLTAAAIDAIAWTDEAGRLLEACTRAGIEVDALRLPAMRRASAQDRWARLDEIYDWDDARHRYLHRSVLVKVCELPMLPARLGERRTENLASFVAETDFTFDPQASNWRTWAPAIASDLARRKKLIRADWEGFYADLAKMPDILPHLRGAKIFRLEDGSLAPANGAADSDGEELFISTSLETASRRRLRVAGARIPPGSIVRKMRFADPFLAWPQQVAEPFVKAQLATHYSLARVLARLGKMLGKRPKRATTVAALGWAFQAWAEHRSPEVEQALKLAALPIPTRAGGSRLPGAVYFAAGWRDTRGDVLQTFLDSAPKEARTLRAMREGLLPSWDEWPLRERGSVAEWVLFLRLLGVNDGLRPIRYNNLKASIFDWVRFMSTDADGPTVEGSFGNYWRRAVRSGSPWDKFRYQSNLYETGESLFGLPGQAEHAAMSPEAKMAYARLLVSSIGELETKHFFTKLSRIGGGSDEVSLTSPIAGFLRLANWIPLARGDEIVWATPDSCWFAPRVEPLPRFIPPIERSVRDALEGSKAAQDAATTSLGLRLWTSPATAVARLQALGTVLEQGVSESEHDAFRKACREAWEHWAGQSPRQTFPSPLTLAVLEDGKPSAFPVARIDEGREPIFISDSTDPMREQLIAALGHPVLPLPDRIAGEVAAALAGRFGGAFPLLSEAGLAIRCDGSDFVPSANATPLVTPGQEWLAEIAVLVLEFNEGLSNRNTVRSRQSLYDDFRKLRIAFARRVEVEVEGRVGELPPILDRVLAVPDSEFPTLIVQSGTTQLDWPLLARISRALPMALERPSLAMAFRVAFLEIARAQAEKHGLARPSDEEIALALGHSPSRVQEVYRSLRSTTQRLFENLVPATHVFLGAAAAQAVLQKEHLLLEDAEIAALLRQHGAGAELAAQLVETCRSAESLDAARRALAIDLPRINEALARLGAPWQTLSFEPRLRARFEKRKEARRAELETRVRDAFIDAYDAGADLAPYVDLKSLDWIVFQPSWIAELDELPDERIDAAVEALCATTLPTSTASPDEALDNIRQRNRTVLVQTFEALRRLAKAWVEKPSNEGAFLPTVWNQSAEDACRAVVASGALDFRLLTETAAAAAFARAGLWPGGMPVSNDPTALGLTDEDIRRRAIEEERAKLEALKARRSVTFGAETIDGGSDKPFHSVAEALQASTASKAFVSRSGKAELEPFADGGGGGGGGSGGRKTKRDPEYMSEEQRTLLGFAGEFAAYTYLRRTVRGFADAHWISSMGRRYLGLDMTADDDGFDFHIPRSQGPDLYFEVKAHRGDPGYVDLERSQVAAALSMADGRQGLWSILYVPYVTNLDLVAVHELANPFAKGSELLYRELGKRSVRLEMKRR